MQRLFSGIITHIRIHGYHILELLYRLYKFLLVTIEESIRYGFYEFSNIFLLRYFRIIKEWTELAVMK